MGKQTETNKNKSKKNSSFTGRRVIGDKKSSHYDNDNSDVDGNTTEDMMKLLDTDVSPSNMSGQNQSQNQNQFLTVY